MNHLTAPDFTMGVLSRSSSTASDASNYDGNEHAPYFILDAQFHREFDAEWELGRRLGKGAFGTTYECVRRQDGLHCCAKIIRKYGVRSQAEEQAYNLHAGRMRDEVQTLMRLNKHEAASRHIIDFVDAYEDAETIVVLMEFASGGDLCDDLEAKIHRATAMGEPLSQIMSEATAREIFLQICHGVKTMHDASIMHGDLKPDNVVWTSDDENDPERMLKIVDFGVARYWVPTKAQPYLSEPNIGTLYYLAPEVIDRKFSLMADMWALGVILYILLCGQPPFRGKGGSKVSLIRRIKRGFGTKRDQAWFPRDCTASEEARNVVCALLSPSHKRVSINELMDMPWVASASFAAATGPVSPSFYECLVRFNSLSEFQNHLLLHLYHHVKPWEVELVREAFAAIDANHDGIVTLQEFKDALTACAPDSYLTRFKQALAGKDIENLFALIDSNHDGGLEVDELLRVVIYRKVQDNYDLLLRLFESFDLNRDHAISKQEIISTLHTVDPEDVDRVFDELDLNGDGLIDFDEFVSSWAVRSDMTGDSVAEASGASSNVVAGDAQGGEDDAARLGVGGNSKTGAGCLKSALLIRLLGSKSDGTVIVDSSSDEEDNADGSSSDRVQRLKTT